CHAANGRGVARGPDLSNIAQRMRLTQMEQKLLDPATRIPAGFQAASAASYEPVTVALADGRTLRGLARAQGSHDLVLQTDDGKLLPLLDSQYKSITPDTNPAMPAFTGTRERLRDVLAYLATLKGVGVGAFTTPQPAPTQAQMDAVAHPAKGQWPGYNGTLSGNRFSPLDQIDTKNAAKLQLAWTFPTTFNGLETTPVVVDG